MSHFKLFIVAALAVLAVGVASVSSASAETCTGGTSLVFCTSPGNVPLVGETILGLGTLALLATILGGAEAKFHCLDVHVSGTLEALGAGKGKLLFLNCTMEKPAKCKLSMKNELDITANFTAQQQSLTLALFIGSEAGEKFTELEVENKPGETCAAVGSFSVTGRQMVETPNGAKGEIDQEIVAKKSESFLKFGVEAASFSSTAKVHLGGANIGSAWLVMHGE